MIPSELWAWNETAGAFERVEARGGGMAVTNPPFAEYTTSALTTYLSSLSGSDYGIGVYDTDVSIPYYWNGSVKKEMPRTTEGSSHVNSSSITAEVADVSASDHTVTINGGKAMGIYISGAGDVKVDTYNGETITFKALPAGFHPIACTKIYTTGTTVSDKTTGIIVGGW